MSTNLEVVMRYWGKADPNYLGEPKWRLPRRCYGGNDDRKPVGWCGE